jgi:hypothetical protein
MSKLKHHGRSANDGFMDWLSNPVMIRENNASNEDDYFNDDGSCGAELLLSRSLQFSRDKFLGPESSLPFLSSLPQQGSKES